MSDRAGSAFDRHPLGDRSRGVIVRQSTLIIVMVIQLAGGAMAGRAQGADLTWFVFMGDRLSRTDAANALYESTRRQDLRRQPRVQDPAS